MNQDKLNFIAFEFTPLLKDIPADATGKWGKMNAQQMIEHVSGFFKVSSNKLHFPLVTPVEHLPKFKEFLMSDKAFRENTQAPVLPKDPLPVRLATIQQSIDELDNEIKGFIDIFNKNSSLKTRHPVFGDLDFAEWVQLHHKHVMHHLKQFGLI